ncbi:unnamed protein product [Heligmosomoides polygyrus]|uniref:Uncharacterized protein n=1 Tax=Heligmosomoides polygyrus TaxID=6339 RepID=A0A3P8AAX9_HELPZ|nr:unnamed protein product [Heligmosomoides polygyrus]
MKKGPHVTQNGTNGVDAAAKAAGVTAPDTIGGLPMHGPPDIGVDPSSMIPPESCLRVVTSIILSRSKSAVTSSSSDRRAAVFRPLIANLRQLGRELQREQEQHVAESSILWLNALMDQKFIANS